ncbi:MAG: site-specific integrase [Verrucomicrobiota bacterium]|nr:site-specific integrase [Verrucomicrobiota bacterium]
MKYVTGIKVKKGKHPQFPWEAHVAKRLFGKRSRKKFETEAEAKAHALKMSRKVLNKERVPLDPEVHKIVALYAEKLTPSQIQTMLEEGVRRYSVEAKSLSELVKEYLAKQETLQEEESVGQDHLNTVKCLSNKLVDYLGDPLVRDIDLNMVEDMKSMRLKTIQQNGKPVSKRTVRNEVNQLSAIFNYGIAMKYVTDNPTLHVKLPEYKAPVGICKPDDLQKLLLHADHHLQCFLMFGAFGGLRTSEIMRMRWVDVRIDEGQFYIAGTKNENAERWVNMTPPLMDFCKQVLEGENPPHGLVMGGMVNNTRCRKLTKLYKAVGYNPKRNYLRHSYGSHHLIQFQNADNTANEMGHVGPQQTFKAYRKAVLKSQAADYFNIRAEAKPWIEVKGMGIKKPRKAAQRLAA